MPTTKQNIMPLMFSIMNPEWGQAQNLRTFGLLQGSHDFTLSNKGKFSVVA